MSKKRIIAIITIIVLLFAAGISVGVFLYGRAETQATEGNQASDQNQDDVENQGSQDSLIQGNTHNNNDNEVTNPVDNETVEYIASYKINRRCCISRILK